MRTNDQRLIEEAYGKINEGHMPGSGIDPEVAKMYYSALEKFQNDEITSQQWYDICAKLLGDLMEQHKDVFVRLKHR